MESKALRQHGDGNLAGSTDLVVTPSGASWKGSIPPISERAKPTALTEPQLVHIDPRLVVCPNIRGTDLHAGLRHEIGPRPLQTGF